MAYRAGLHTMIDLLADNMVFEGRRVVIEIINGSEIRFGYEPPLDPKIECGVAVTERRVSGRLLS
jgi:hypothetical protein